MVFLKIQCAYTPLNWSLEKNVLHTHLHIKVFHLALNICSRLIGFHSWMSWSSAIKIICDNHKFSLFLKVYNDVVVQQCDLMHSILLKHRAWHLLPPIREIFCSFVTSMQIIPMWKTVDSCHIFLKQQQKLVNLPHIWCLYETIVILERLHGTRFGNLYCSIKYYCYI